MIVCSQCQFENPVHHRYCQRCGELLPKNEPQWTIQAAEEFKTEVTVDSTLTSAESDSIDSNTAVPHQDSVANTELSQKTMNSSSSGDTVTTQTLLAIVTHMDGQGLHQKTPRHLDSGQRYRVITEMTPDVAGKSLEVIVIDTQPNNSPYYQDLQTQATEKCTLNRATTNIAVPLITGLEATQGDGDTKPLPLSTDNFAGPSLNLPLVSSEAPSALNSATFRPASPPTPPKDKLSRRIETYIALQDLLYPSFPTVQDAWDDEGSIIILENRDCLEHLKDVVTQPTVVPPQILHWCHEMTEIWEVLNTHACCQSLLTLDNVRVDEDHILCLRRLYFDPYPNHYSLKELGILWQTLFTQNASALQQCPEELTEICRDLAACSIADIEALRRRLEIAADQIHHNALTHQVPSNGTSEPHDNDVWQSSGPVENPDLSNTDGDESELSTSPTSTHQRESDNPGESNISETEFDGELIENDSPSLNIGDDPTVVLPMQLHTLANSGLTNIGIQRDHNEDFFSMDTNIHTSDTPAGRICRAKGLYILCDGMGGHAAGEVASAAAGESLTTFFHSHWQDEFPDESMIQNAIIAANQDIYDQNQADASEGSRRMGTTLVMLLVQDTKAAIAHVGDSRIYRFTRRQGLEQLTVDHEVGQREIARGVSPDIAYARPDAYQLTQALGPRDQDFIRPDIQFIDMTEDALFILGSDGLTDNELLETYCDSHISPLISSNANLEEGAHNLIDLANQVNGHDNITVLLVRIKLRPKLSILGR